MKTLALCLLFILLPQTLFSKDTLVAGLFNIVPYAHENNGKIEGITP